MKNNLLYSILVILGATTVGAGIDLNMAVLGGFGGGLIVIAFFGFIDL